MQRHFLLHVLVFQIICLGLLRRSVANVALKDQIQYFLDGHVISGHDIEPKSFFTRSLVEELASWLPHLPKRHFTVDVERSTVQSANDAFLPNPDDELCEHDYSWFCPQNWVDMGDGRFCTAPFTYKGPCEHQSDMSVQTPLQRAAFAKRCEVVWPCMGSCAEEFLAPCPLGWVHVAGAICRAPESYRGKCIRSVDFTGHNPYHKRLWARSCGVRWPCRAMCDADLSPGQCPDGWTSLNATVCKAPETYLGPCSPVQDFGARTVEDKLSFVQLCRARWPCRSSETNHGGLHADSSFSDCPLGWKMSNSTSQCHPQPEYRGPCSKPTDFGEMPISQKLSWAAECQTLWVPRSSCEYDYRHPCPKGWTLHRTHCVAPEEYLGSCSLRHNFANYTTIMKAGFAFRCNAPWSCASTVQHAPSIMASELGELDAAVGIVSGTNGPVNMTSLRVEPSMDLPLGVLLPEDNPTSTTEDAESKENMRNHLVLLESINALDKTVQVHAAIQAAKRMLQHGDAPVIFRTNRSNTDTTIRGMGLPRLAQIAPSNPFTGAAHRDVSDNSSGWGGNYPSMADYKIVPQKSILAEPLVEAKRILKLLRFPEVALYKKKLRLQEDEAAASDRYEGFMKSEEEGCPVDMDLTCPRGWKQYGVFCQADASYAATHRCPGIIPFGVLSATVRHRYRRLCGVEWECKRCDHDYVRPHCPQGWIHEGNGICRASKHFIRKNASRCETKVNFRYMVPELRRLWAVNCGADWPCFQEDPYDLSAPCPDQWTLVDKKNGTCAAPDEYKGGCGRILNIPEEMHEKISLAYKCEVQWPKLKLCKISYWQRCPYGWVADKIAGCKAPDSASTQITYDGPCPKEQRFSRFTNFYRKLYSQRCHVAWPCDDQCEQDFTEPCPLDWEETGSFRRTYCQPEWDYKGHCLGKYEMTDMTFHDKRLFAWQCEVKWPCGGYLLGRLRIPFIGTGWQTEEKRRDAVLQRQIGEKPNNPLTIFAP